MNTSTATFTKDTTRRSLHNDIIDGKLDLIRTAATTSHEPKDEYDSSESLETASDEIPVWIHGEQRWISGVNEETTCADLVNVLLADEGINPCSDNNTTTSKGFVITERWRRVEQILQDETKILQIWAAWGHAKPEVKLTLRQIEPMMTNWTNSSNEQDSGMGSPNGSTNSAIIRRRRHRASKSTTAWVTQAQTIHPKSQKGTIEKLMKLILEQGETIQHQLAKLRDRELQIAKIEEDRHKLREREHGKNYLLETYLNGLHEAEEKEIVTVNSDSGVQTEGATSSPEIGIHDDEGYPSTRSIKKYATYTEKPSHREKKLLKDHNHIKEYTAILSESCADVTNDIEDDASAKIEWMEKLVVINKHLQREEELLVRLGAKIRKYESENPALSEQQIREALQRVNTSIESRNDEMKRLEDDLNVFNEKLEEKTSLLDVLSKELIAMEETEDPGPVNLNSEKLVENLYNFSQYISKPNYDFNENNENRDQKLLARHTPDHILSMESLQQTSQSTNVGMSLFLEQKLPPPLQYSDNDPSQIAVVNHKAQAPILKCRNQNPLCSSLDIVTSMNLLHKPDQIKFNSNVYSTSVGIRGAGKLGPKKLISGICTEFESNSDTGLSSMGEDAIHMGTLV